jgi:Dynamin GTPase effector domain
MQTYNKVRTERGFGAPSVQLPAMPYLETSQACVVYNEPRVKALYDQFTVIIQQLEQCCNSLMTPGSPDSLQQQAISMACYLEAYWEVSCSRYVDNVCSAVSTDILHELADQLRTAATALTMDTATVQRVMVEDAAVAQQRAALTDKVERLTKAIDTLKRAARAQSKLSVT